MRILQYRVHHKRSDCSDGQEIFTFRLQINFVLQTPLSMSLAVQSPELYDVWK